MRHPIAVGNGNGDRMQRAADPSSENRLPDAARDQRPVQQARSRHARKIVTVPFGDTGSCRAAGTEPTPGPQGGAGPEEACDTWHAAGARLVVITLGGRGALASLDGHRVTVPTPAVDVVDTVGAGDSFTAGLLHRLAALGHLGGRLDRLNLEDLTDACTFAARVAALTCSVSGANPPRLDEAALEVGVEQLLPHA
jgi:fructokinase